MMIQSVSRALDILLLVAEAKGEPVTLGEIARRSGLNKSTAAHLLETLRLKGYVHQISRSSGYVLGAYAYYLTRYKKFHADLVLTCNPMMRWMQRQLGSPVLLAVLADNRKFIVSYSEDEQSDLHERGDLFLGNLYASATGRVLLSRLRQSELETLVREIGMPTDDVWPGVRTFADLQARLQAVRMMKCVVVPGDREIAFAAPLAVDGAVGIPEPLPPGGTLCPQRRALIEHTLLRCVREINRRLRFDAREP